MAMLANEDRSCHSVAQQYNVNHKTISLISCRYVETGTFTIGCIASDHVLQMPEIIKIWYI